MRLIDSIAARDGWLCHYCGRDVSGDLPPSLRATIDHKVPRSKGGSDAPDNLVIACAHCNAMKRERSYADFAASPRTMSGPGRIRSVRIADELWESVKTGAAQEGLTVSDVARMALLEYVNEE